MTTRIERALLLLAFAAAAAAPPATAQTNTRELHTYHSGDASLPELASDYLRSHPGEALQIASFTQTGREPFQMFFAFGTASRSRAGVCHYTATQLFPHRVDGGTVTWDNKPEDPNEHVEPPSPMAAVAAMCPPQSDETYAVLDDGITDAEFIAVVNFWNTIAKSQDRFDEVTGLLPLIISNRAAERFDMFRTAVFRQGAPPVQLRAVFNGGVDAYDLAFALSGADAPNFFVSISKNVSGFQVVNFQTQY
jgi:hypothetical protein